MHGVKSTFNNKVTLLGWSGGRVVFFTKCYEKMDGKRGTNEMKRLNEMNEKVGISHTVT